MANLLVSNTLATARSLAQREADLALEPEATSLAAWWRVEDLWLRLQTQLPVAVRREADGEALVFRSFRSGSAGELRSAALNPQCYAWETDGVRGSFVQQLWYQGDDLVCLLSARSVIKRWPEGDEIADRMRCFLVQLDDAPGSFANRSADIGRTTQVADEHDPPEVQTTDLHVVARSGHLRSRVEQLARTPQAVRERWEDLRQQSRMRRST